MPDAAHVWMPIIATLAVVNILFCGLVALTQRDIKYVLGYSSCSHMGYIFISFTLFNKLWKKLPGVPIHNWGFSINFKWVQGFLFEGSPQFTGEIKNYDLLDVQINKHAVYCTH